MKKIKILGKQLSKNEQKHFGGGLRDDGGTGGAYCLHCVGFGGACGTMVHSHWPRSSVPNASSECQTVYAGCDHADGDYTVGGCTGNNF